MVIGGHNPAVGMIWTSNLIILGGRAISDPIVAFDEAVVRSEPRELVWQTVEDTLNALLEEEAGDLAGAGWRERTVCRAGH